MDTANNVQSLIRYCTHLPWHNGGSYFRTIQSVQWSSWKWMFCAKAPTFFQTYVFNGPNFFLSEAVSGNTTRRRNSRSDLHVTECKFSFTRSAKCICNIIQVHTSLKINDIQVIFVFYRLTLISVWYRKKRKHLILEQSSPRINKFVQDIKVGIEVKLMQNSIVLCFFNFFESFFFFQVTF